MKIRTIGIKLKKLRRSEHKFYTSREVRALTDELVADDMVNEILAREGKR